MVVQGMGGVLSMTGYPNQPPARVGISIGDITAGLYLTIGLNAALYKRTITKLGSKIDIAMLDCQVAILEDAIPAYDKTGEIPGPLGTRHPSIAPFQSFHAKDASIIIAAGNDHLFELMAGALSRPDLIADVRFKTNELRHENIEVLQKEMETTLATKPVADWLALLNTAGVPCGPINDVPHVIADPQVAARNMVIEVDDPVIGKVKTAGNPVKVVGAADETTMRPSPELDADRAAILAEFVGAAK
jgi:CoA:oxalate CoA-transferase